MQCFLLLYHGGFDKVTLQLVDYLNLGVILLRVDFDVHKVLVVDRLLELSIFDDIFEGLVAEELVLAVTINDIELVHVLRQLL